MIHNHRLSNKDLPHVFALAKIRNTTNYFFCPECKSMVSGKTHPVADKQIIDYFNKSCGNQIKIRMGLLKPQIIKK